LKENFRKIFLFIYNEFNNTNLKYTNLKYTPTKYYISSKPFNSEGITEGNPRAGDAQTNSGDFFVGRPVIPRSYYLRLTFNF
jgi:hypothetical protein